MRIDTDRVATQTCFLLIVAAAGLLGSLVYDNHDMAADVQGRVKVIEHYVEEQHQEPLPEPEGFWKSIWNGVSFKKYRSE